MQRVKNPPNPYLGDHLEWLGEPPAARLEVFEESARSILSSNDSPDIPFRYSLNPYRGCQHACAYCYARVGHERLGFGAGSDFDAKIVVKTNAPQLLREQFRKPSWKGARIAFSGDTDCYQTLESSYGLTRACLEVCLEFSNPVGIITKSALIRRDVDLLARLAVEARARVTMSIAFADLQTSRAVEPLTPAPAARFEALRHLADAGIPTGVLIAPVIPGFNDDDVPEILERAADAGARWAGMMPLRLPGVVAGVFLERLRASRPERASRIESRIREMRGGELNDARFFERYSGTGAYWQAVESLFALHRDRLGLECPPTRRDGEPTTFRRDGADGEQLSLFENR